jgi:predicted transcriptional regulator
MKESSYNMKPQDVVILFKILAWGGNDWNQSMLSAQLNISQSEISESIRRSKYSGLISTIV